MYLLAYFRTEREALHYAVSADGLSWKPLRNNLPFYESPLGTRSIRDPFLCRARDGAWRLLSSNGWNAGSIFIAESPDLLEWRNPRLVPVMQGIEGTRNCWAPEAYYAAEEDLYYIIWSSTVQPAGMTEDPGHRIWHATTRDFEEFSPPAIYFDPGYNVIDATVAPHNGGYMMAFKDERGANAPETGWKALRVCFAPRACGPWTGISELLTPALTEGPTLFRHGADWLMLYDHFMNGRFGIMRSTNGTQWEILSDRLEMPFGPRHGCVVDVPDDFDTAQL